MLAWLWPNRQDTVALALADLVGRGPGWRARLRQGVAALLKTYPRLRDDDSLRTALTIKR
jgi:hypothetical protein